MKKSFVRYLPYCGVIAAATFIFTTINFTVPIVNTKGCLVHLGAAMAVAVVFMLPPVYGALSVALGMSMYDIIGGWTMWAPFTFVIRFLQVYVLAKLMGHATHKTLFAVIGFILAMIIDVGGYYMAEVIIYGNWIAPLVSVPGNLVQIGLASAIVLPVVQRLKKHAVALSWAGSRR